MEVYKQIKNDIFSCAVIYIIFTLVWAFCPYGKDSTDPKWGRSGLIVRTDNKTGLQYLQSSGGHLVPRLDKDGNQMVSDD